MGDGTGEARWRRLVRRATPGARLRDRTAEIDGRLDQLGDAHHVTRSRADEALEAVPRIRDDIATDRQRLDHLTRRVGDLERAATIRPLTSWIENMEVPASLLVSVILPTRNRARLVPRAIASVERQVYARWELLVVDDGSDDDTPEVLAEHAGDPRVRVQRAEGVGAAGARNLGLDAASGDVVVYLDDDNVFDPLWFKAVVWAFEQRPDVDILYGARVIDDLDRIRRVGSGAMPSLDFEPYDRANLERHNFVDMGAIAHRSKLPEARFDPAIPVHQDWDLILRLTADRPPLELPVVALYYTSDSPDRLSDGDLSDIDLVRAKLREQQG